MINRKMPPNIPVAEAILKLTSEQIREVACHHARKAKALFHAARLKSVAETAAMLRELRPVVPHMRMRGETEPQR